MKIEFCTTVKEFFLNIIVYTLPELDWQKHSQLKACEIVSKASV